MALDNLIITKLDPITPFNETYFVSRKGVQSSYIKDFIPDIPPYIRAVLIPHNSNLPLILYIGDPDALNQLMFAHKHPKAYTAPFDSPPYDPDHIGLTCPRLRVGYVIGENQIYLSIGRGYARTPYCHH